MSAWIAIDNRSVDVINKKIREGVTVEASVSPYDIPSAVRGYMRVEDGWFVIEYKYLSDEPVIKLHEDAKIRIYIGINSGRLIQLHLNAIILEEDKDQMQRKYGIERIAKDAIKYFNELDRNIFNTMRMNVSQNVIELKKDEIFAEI
jgi:hypothetical protein